MWREEQDKGCAGGSVRSLETACSHGFNLKHRSLPNLPPPPLHHTPLPPPLQISCPSGVGCISPLSLCDGRADCLDGSDEGSSTCNASFDCSATQRVRPEARRAPLIRCGTTQPLLSNRHAVQKTQSLNISVFFIRMIALSLLLGFPTV